MSDAWSLTTCRRGSCTPRVTALRSPWQNPYAERLIGSMQADRFVPGELLQISLESFNAVRGQPMQGSATPVWQKPAIGFASELRVTEVVPDATNLNPT